ncbi:methionine gamma-lyase family protein [Agathobaculum sp. NTUH-O15-33]|uniref:methionine gamma-lyase family protein n=1 Tax=Agathobaculum sp. NTUH-O15-33 TaxID=3079302 RepID=UPI00295843BB|nr:methionine gamma-lyase family protein [Agathobaculum sp. NTUH-O15-33]WNX86474.1 methionine gamma-lyase family protein [Agathobaculum sp. NTUH-O15-33]
MSDYLAISEEIRALGRQAEREIMPYFSRINEICEENTEKVLAAFAKNRVSDNLFAGTTGYGYDDHGRDTLDRIYADLFGTEAALVRIGFVNGTHTLSCAMFSAVSTGDTVLSVTGPAYDTLQNTITGDGCGSMKRYGIGYKQVDLVDGRPDLPAIDKAVRDDAVKLVFIQRSRGYAVRQTLSCAEIGEICKTVREAGSRAVIMVDNCYGEFVETIEPTQVGADLVAGSLIKNPGGGLAPTGGYIAGRADLVENASYRLTAPGIGGECGATLGQNRLLYQGIFMAPHTTAQALKTAIFCAKVMEMLGYEVSPKAEEPRYDIIQTIAFGAPDPLRRFCEGIQAGAPVDSFVTPEPWAMPGYDDPVIMAAGAFVQGASIELSADAPMREPYVCYMQGGLTYSSGKAGILLAAERIQKQRRA